MTACLPDQEPCLSVIVPAYNEEAELGPTLASIFAAGTALVRPFEVLVVDDASTDRTAEIARSFGARVVPVARRQIAAVRNAGAREARGRTFLFVDADTRVTPGAVAAAVRAIDRGAVGGGARMHFDHGTPWWVYPLIGLTQCVFACARLSGGAFLFARREVFQAIGGFDERFFASEEIHFCRALSARGPFAIIYRGVTTSARKVRMHGAGLLLKMSRFLREGPAALQRREGLELWYDGQREG